MDANFLFSHEVFCAFYYNTPLGFFLSTAKICCRYLVSDFFSLIFMFVLHKWAASLENFVFWGRWLAENENCVLAHRQWLFSVFILIIFVLMFFMSSWWYFIDWVNFDCGLQVLKYLKNNLVTILRSYCAIQFLEQIDIPTPCPWQEEGV